MVIFISQTKAENEKNEFADDIPIFDAISLAVSVERTIKSCQTRSQKAKPLMSFLLRRREICNFFPKKSSPGSSSLFNISDHRTSEKNLANQI